MSSPALSGAERGLTVLLAGPPPQDSWLGGSPASPLRPGPWKPMQSPAPGAASGRREAVCTTVYQPSRAPPHHLLFSSRLRQARPQGAVGPGGQAAWEDG